MKKPLAAAAVAASLAVGIPAFAAGGTQSNPLGVQFSAVAYAYSYGDYMHTLTVTTGKTAIHDLELANPGYPSVPAAPYVPVASEVPAHSTVTLLPNLGAWDVNIDATLILPITYKDAAGRTYSAPVTVTYSVG